MKVLVTGGAGFVGSHIVDALLNEGHDPVVIDNLVTGERSNLPTGVRFYRADIRSRELIDILRRERPEVVNHHAAQTTVQGSTRDPKYDADVNLMGLINLMEASGEAGVRKVIFASSGGTVYGNSLNLPVKEDEKLNPVSPYGITKMASEFYIRYFAEQYGFQYTVLRYSNIFGPRDHASSEHVITVFVDMLLAGKVPMIHWDGEQAKDYLYVSDCAAANLAALSKGDGQVYNIGSGHLLSVNEIFRQVTSQMNMEVTPQYGPKRPGDVRSFYLNIEKAKAELGWQPVVPFGEGLSRTISYFSSERPEEEK